MSTMHLEKEFFYDEVREGFYIPGMMKRAWGAELAVLKEIDTICKKHRIPYFLSSGTLLGAVREGGQFIPWDDDLDIMMFRKDYLQFLHFAKEELPEELYIRALEVDVRQASFVPKVGLKEELCSLSTLEKYGSFPYNVEIDIFLLDALSDKEEEEAYRKEVLNLLYSLNDVVRKEASDEEVEPLLKKVEEILHYHFDRRQSLVSQFKILFDRIFREFNGTEGKKVAIFPYYYTNGICACSRKALAETIELPFCGMRFPVAKGYDEQLRAEYGDWHKKYKAGGDHGYPCFLESEERVFRLFPEKAFPKYLIKKESIERSPVRSLREQYLEIVDSFLLEEEKGAKLLREGEVSSYQALLAALQETVIAFGGLLEKRIGKDTESISLVERYCEMLYQRYQSASSLAENGEEVTKKEEIEKSGETEKRGETEADKSVLLLQDLKKTIGKEQKVQIVFLLHRAKDFAGFRPLIDGLRKENVDCKIMPIPYYEKAVTGELTEMHYEGADFPEEYAITAYQSYDFAQELPDCIVMNSPYDEFNPVFSIDPFFYSRNMKQYTGKLVYLPWFVTDEINPKDPEDGKAFYNMRYYVTVPGVFHADYTLVQSEGMKEAYLEKIALYLQKEGLFGTEEQEEVLSRMRQKILAAGSCLIQAEGQGTEAVLRTFRTFLFPKSPRREVQ